MKNIILFFKNNVRRNLLSLFISIGGGIILCVFFTLMGAEFGENNTNKVVVGYINQEESILTDDFKEFFEENLNFEMIEDKSYDYLSNELIEKRISAIIEIPKGFEADGIKLQGLGKVVVTTLDDYVNKVFLEAYIDSYCNSINLILMTSEGKTEVFHELMEDYKHNNVTVSTALAYRLEEESNRAGQGLILSIGFFLMIMFGIGLCIAFIVFEDRENGVFNRIVISPVKGMQYIIGTSLFSVATGLLMVLIYCGYIGYQQGEIGISIWILIYMMFMFILIMVGFSLVIALFMESKNSIMSCIIAFGTIGPILGGAYFRADMSPELIQKIGKLTPHYWFMQALRDVVENSKEDITASLVILPLFAILFFLIAAVKFVHKESSRA